MARHVNIQKYIYRHSNQSYHRPGRRRVQNPVVGCKGQQQQSCDRYVCEVELLSVAFSGEVHYRARTEDVVEHANGAQGSRE